MSAASLHAARPADEPVPGPAASMLDGPVTFTRESTEHCLGGRRDDLRAHEDRYGVRPSALGAGGEALLGALHAVALSGRGGAHFPTARKWRAALDDGPVSTVVVNAAEGEPAAAKDAALVQQRPHLVLDGLALAAETMGTSDAVVWLHAGAHTTRDSLENALAERRAAGLADPDVRIVEAPDRYLSGEATAVMRALDGGPALPHFVRDPARPWGEGHAPVLLQNAETMARVALVARDPHGYRASALVTVLGPDRRTVLEVGPTTTIREVVSAAWPVPAAPQAVLMGGYGGQWVPWSVAAPLPVDVEGLRAAGLSLGAGVIVPLPADTCGLAETARLLHYLADSGARQCGPCLMGLPALAGLMDDLVDGRIRREGGRRRLDTVSAAVLGRGACRHPDGAVRVLASALQTFASDVTAHRRGRCQHPGTAAVLHLPPTPAAERSASGGRS